MRDDELERSLREELAKPVFAAPRPADARYARRGRLGARLLGSGLRLSVAFAAGALVAVIALSAGTGSQDPRVWTVKVTSALSEIGAPPSPTPVPTSHEAGSTPSPSAKAGGESEQGSPVPGSRPTAEPERASSPEPAATAEPGDGGGHYPGRSPSASPSPGGEPGDHNFSPSPWPSGRPTPSPDR